jgi:CRP-like cAMP-binding protein
MISPLSDEQRRQLEKLTRMLEVKRRTRIYLPGDPSDQIFLLKRGVIKISMTTPDNREVILTFLHPVISSASSQSSTRRRGITSRRPMTTA